MDYLLVGKLLGSEALGIYTMAFRLSRYPIEKMGPVLGRMLMPAFALMQDNPEQIRTNVLRISAFVALITVPFLVFFIFYHRTFSGFSGGGKVVRGGSPD
ncbi:MAG: oligosaccharide flippase family protein [Methylococcales bacterium]|nr:oligosaccharide flippase family protein [Methylococcales bacterium]